MRYKIILTKKAIKDLLLLRSNGLEEKAKRIRDILAINPYDPPYEKLVGNLKGKYFRRINLKHRLVYEILENIKTVKILGMWSHYDDN
jgi:Txe/YoeB family toxin of toxin-antitoxin system